MWGAIGLLCVALFVGANASLLECPNDISHADEYYYILDGAPFMRITLTPWTGVEGLELKCGSYPPGKTLKVSPGECDIKCEVCIAPGFCCDYKYLLTVVDKRCSEETIENGAMSIQDEWIGGTASVTCNANYILVGGSSTVTCVSDADFSAANGAAEEVGQNDPYWKDLPRCERVRCGKPGEGQNTEPVSIDAILPGDAYDYSCQPGFTADPEDLNIVCELNPAGDAADYNKDPPTCRRVRCGKPGEGQNTEPVSIDSALPGDEYDYSCQPGFTADAGDLNIVCELNPAGDAAAYNKDPPTCRRVRCGKPGEGQNTEPVSIDSALPGDEYDYSCQPGFTAHAGDLNIVCELNPAGDAAAYNKDPPTCRRVRCGKPGEGQNTEPVSIDSALPGDEYDYSCQSGFTAHADDLNIVCELKPAGDAAAYNKNPPTCRRVRCGKPGEGQNTEPVSIDSALPGDEYDYSCQPGFTADAGDLNIVCELNPAGDAAAYNKDPPTCRRVRCGKPGEGQNTEPVSIDSALPGDEYDYSCQPGFTAHADDLNIVCELNPAGDAAAYNKDPPTCRRVRCGKPREGQNTEPVSIDSALPGDEYDYSCQPGFTADAGDLNIVCELNPAGDAAAYNKDPPTCRRIRCEKPGEGTNTEPVPDREFFPDDIYQYRCKPDHIADPTTLEIQCRLNNAKNAASWTSDPPTCDEVGHTDVEIRCPRGFEREGDRCYRLVEKEDTWEAQARECKKRNGKLTVPASDRVTKLLVSYVKRKTSRKQVWIGVHDHVQSNVWMDMDVQTLIYTNWERLSKRDPKKQFGPDCASAARGDGRWTNECCYAKYQAVCEAEPLGLEECNNVPRYYPVGDRCLRYEETPGSFEAQCRRCSRHKGILATALTESHSNGLSSFYRGFSDGEQPAWFNLHDLVEENTYQTTDLRLYKYFNWAGSRSSRDGDCGAIGSNGWVERCCYNALPAICELQACPAGYTHQGNNCYRLINADATWEASEKRCRKDKAHLAVFKNAKDFNELKAFLKKGNPALRKGIWFGCHDQVTEGHFQSPTLEKLNFFNWSSGKPSNSPRDCCVLGNNYGMSVNCCYDRLPAICSRRAYT